MDQSKREELRRLLASFDAGMLITATPGGDMPCFPVALGRVSNDGVVTLAAGIDEPIEGVPARTRTYALVCSHLAKHLALEGTLTVTREPSALKQAWLDRWLTWFPKGVDTPTLTLLHFSVRSGEYWDHTGLTRLSYALEAARSFVRGAHVPPLHEQHIHL